MAGQRAGRASCAALPASAVSSLGGSVLFLVNGLGTEVAEESAPSPAGEPLTPAVNAALPLDHLHGTGATVRNDTVMPARQPAEADRPAPARSYEREPAAVPRLTGGSTGSMDPAARDAVQNGADSQPGRMLGDLTSLVGTAVMPAEPTGFRDRLRCPVRAGDGSHPGHPDSGYRRREHHAHSGAGVGGCDRYIGPARNRSGPRARRPPPRLDRFT